MLKCAVCGCEFQTIEQLEESLKIGKVAAEKAEDELTPEKIISIREKPSSSNRMLLLQLQEKPMMDKMLNIQVMTVINM